MGLDSGLPDSTKLHLGYEKWKAFSEAERGDKEESGYEFRFAVYDGLDYKSFFEDEDPSSKREAQRLKEEGTIAVEGEKAIQLRIFAESRDKLKFVTTIFDVIKKLLALFGADGLVGEGISGDALKFNEILTLVTKINDASIELTNARIRYLEAIPPRIEASPPPRNDNWVPFWLDNAFGGAAYESPRESFLINYSDGYGFETLIYELAYDRYTTYQAINKFSEGRAIFKMIDAILEYTWTDYANFIKSITDASKMVHDFLSIMDELLQALQYLGPPVVRQASPNGETLASLLSTVQSLISTMYNKLSQILASFDYLTGRINTVMYERMMYSKGKGWHKVKTPILS